MKRRYLHLLLAGLIGMMAFNVAQSQDKIERKDRKAPDKPIILTGDITDETVAGIKFKSGVKEELIPPTDVMRVFYNKLPVQAKLTFNTMFLNEDKEKDLSKTLKAYQDFAPQVATADLNPKRYVQYKIASLTAQTAQSDPEKEQGKKLLTEFVNAHPASWEYSIAARQLAKMQVEKGEFDDARKTLETLTKREGVPPEIKIEADNMYIDVLFQNGDFDKVKERITAAKAVPATTEVQKARFGVYEIGCEAQGEFKIEDVVKKLDETISKTNDNGVKALAYNVMGDCYSKKGQKRQAMYAWLWVDVVYYQDSSEHQKAMARLLAYFKGEDDKDKVQLYEEKIKRSR